MLIEEHRIQTVGPPIVRHLVKFSVLRLGEVSVTIAGCAAWDVGKATVRRWKSFISPANF